MTDSLRLGHSALMGPDPAVSTSARSNPSGRALQGGEARIDTPPCVPSFDQLYDEHFDFVWRSVRRLGVREAAMDDAVQEVFLVVHRRLPEFEGRSSLKTWLYGIAVNVARNIARTQARRGAEELPVSVEDTRTPGPARHAENREAVALLYRLLDKLDEPKREVFVLAELEQLSAPDIAEALGVNLNTVYSRLRAARRDFEAALQRHRAAVGGTP